jgi:hypothetical protein
MKALTFSSYTNAYAIYIGTQSLGIDTFTTLHQKPFPIPSNSDEIKADWLLFTEEFSLQKALSGEISGKYLPLSFPSNLLDDKWALADWLLKSKILVRGLNQWQLDQLDLIPFPCLLKSRRSWQGDVKLPRGWICHTRHEAEQYLRELEKFEDWANVFFFQEWLGEQKSRVISVCGFHDAKNPSRNLTAIVERIASHTAGLSCSAAVHTISDDWNLQEKNAAILDNLAFTGPYEMEYLVIGERVVVLELNPRFWMQHAIFLIRGNGLIKRYLGLETEGDKQINKVDDVVWIDSIHLLVSMTRLNFAPLFLVFKKYFERGRQILLWPSIPMATFVIARMVYAKIRVKLKNEINR